MILIVIIYVFDDVSTIAPGEEMEGDFSHPGGVTAEVR